jgi:hypothetical protein
MPSLLLVVSNTELLPGFAVMAAAGVAVLVTLLVAGLSRPASARAGMIGGGLPLALLPPLAASAFVAAKTGGLLGGLQDFGPAGQVQAVTASLWQLQSLAWAAFALSCLVGLALGFVGAGGGDPGAAGSARRGVVLVLLPLVGLLLTALLTHRVAKGTRVGAIALSSMGDPSAGERGDAALEAEGFSTDRSGGLGRLARYLSRTTLVGAFGGAFAATVLLGLAIPGFILAWRVRFGAAFRAAAAAVWLIGAVFGVLASLGLLAPFRFS